MKGRPIVSARLDPELAAAVDALADAAGLKRGDVVAVALELLVAHEDAQRLLRGDVAMPAAVAAIVRGS